MAASPSAETSSTVTPPQTGDREGSKYVLGPQSPNSSTSSITTPSPSPRSPVAKLKRAISLKRIPKVIRPFTGTTTDHSAASRISEDDFLHDGPHDDPLGDLPYTPELSDGDENDDFMTTTEELLNEDVRPGERRWRRRHPRQRELRKSRQRSECKSFPSRALARFAEWERQILVFFTSWAVLGTGLVGWLVLFHPDFIRLLLKWVVVYLSVQTIIVVYSWSQHVSQAAQHRIHDATHKRHSWGLFPRRHRAH